MKTARYLSLILVLLLCMLGVHAGAENRIVATSTIDLEEFFGITNEELFEMYVDDKLYDRDVAVFSDAAYVNLTEKQKKLYDAAVPAIKEIAQGARASTEIELDTASLIEWGYVLEGTFVETSEIEGKMAATWAAIVGDFDAALQALIIDHPFDFYWCNRYGHGYGGTYWSDGSYMIEPLFIFYVDPDFRPADYNKEHPTVDTAKTMAATSATTKAQGIVDKYAYSTDSAKILGYIDAICAMTSYNDEAAKNMDSAQTDNSPWQLLWVFDDDETTEVVCEGYAKAFQYLCDLTEFKSDLVKSYIVTGNMTGGIGEGPHMWNVVTMDDGKNYIVDVTNSDDGNVGKDGQFKLGGTTDYRPEYDPTPELSKVWGDTYAFYCNEQQTMYFTYDADLPYTEEQLALQPYNYGTVASVTSAGKTSYYTEFSKAVSAWAAAEEATLVLLKDQTTTGIEVRLNAKDLTLDLNGYTLTNKDRVSTLVSNTGGSLTIVGKGKLVGGSAAACIFNDDDGSLTISGDVVISGQTSIEYTSGTIDLSGVAPAANAIGWKIKNNSNGVADNAITLPEGLGLDKSLTAGATATIIEAVALPTVATVNGTPYTDFTTAVENWTEGTTLKLLANVSMDGNLTIPVSANNGEEPIFRTLDLGSYTLTSGGIDVKGNLIIAGTGSIGNTVISIYDTSLIKITNANCTGWGIKNCGEVLAILDPNEWLPNGYALQIGNKIDCDLERFATGTIVAHSTCDFSKWGTSDEEHWKGCACGRTQESAPHSFTATYTIDGDGTHKGTCVCGQEGVSVPHTAPDAEGKCVCGAVIVASVTIADETTYFGTLDAALNKAEGQTATVTMLAAGEITNSIEFESPSDVTLNLNGQTITARRGLYVWDDSILTITGNGNYEVVGVDESIVVKQNGKVVIENGTFKNEEEYGMVLMVTGEATITGGNITTKGRYSTPIYGNVTVTGEPTFSGHEKRYEFSIGDSHKLDLSGVTGDMHGWRVNANGGKDVDVGDRLILPATGYVLMFDGKIVTTLPYGKVGTIEKHDHNYFIKESDDTYHWNECACGATTDKVEHIESYQLLEGQEVHTVACSDCGYTMAATSAHVFTDGATCVCGVTPVAKVDKTYYANFANAVTAWEVEEAVQMTLLESVEYGEDIAPNHRCDGVSGCRHKYTKILDLNGKTLKSTCTGNYALSCNLPLTIQDTSTDHSGKFVADSAEKVINNGGRSLTLEGGTITIQEGYALDINGTPIWIDSDKVKLDGQYGEIMLTSRPESLIITGTGCDGWEVFNYSPNAATITIDTDRLHLEDESGKKLDANDKLPGYTNTFIKLNHDHNWSYTAEGATITATCSGTVGNCPVEGRKVTVTLPAAEFTYDDTEKSVVPDYSVENSGLEAQISYAGDRVIAGTFTATMKLDDKTVSKVYTIAAKHITSENIATIADQTYTGAAIEPEITITIDGKTLEKDTDYTVAYGNNTNVGTATVTVTGMGNYTGEVSMNFTISAADISGATIEDIPNQVYTGQAITPELAITMNGKTLVKGTDYTVAYADNVGVGTATVTVSGVGNYAGTASATFQITKGNSALTAATYLVDLEKTDFIYGQTITVKGQAALQQQNFALRTVTLNKAALYYGEVLLAEDDVDADGAFTLTYNTTGKALKIGTNKLTVVYGGSGNLEGQTIELEVTLKKADPKYTVPTGLTATYGQTLGSVTLQTTEGDTAGTWAWKEPNALVGDAGEHTHVAIFNPTDTVYYNTVEVDVTITVDRLAIASVTAPKDQELEVYCPTVEEISKYLPETVAGTGADDKSYNVPVKWSCDNFNAEADAVNTFTWAALPTVNLAVKEDFTGTITVKNGSALAVTITPADETIAYDGKPFDVSTLFTIDENAGAATYVISAMTGEGTLAGTELTITKAGTFTIKVTTAAHVKDNVPYAAAEAKAALTVNKGTPAYTIPTGLTATYGQTLNEVTLPEAENGAWAWQEPGELVGNVGTNTHKAIFTPTNTDLWNPVEADVVVTVGKADIPLNATAKTYLGDVAMSDFTYGDVITVKVTPNTSAVMLLADFDEPTSNQMALFYGSRQISAPADPVDGVYTMTYATTDKVLPAGASSITVRYVGTDSYNSGSADLPVTISPAVLTISTVTAANRPYEQGNLYVEITGAELDGKKADADDVSVDLTALKAAVASEKADVYDEVVLAADSVKLIGKDAAYYEVTGEMKFAVTVEITKAEPKPEGTPDFGDVPSGTTLEDVSTDAIADLFKPIEGTVTWNDPADTPVEPGKEYEWTFTPDDDNYEPVTGESVIIPVAPPQPPVKPVVLPTVILPTQDQFVTLNAGDTVTMPVTAINADSYQWYVNRNDGKGYTPISGADSAALTITVTEWENGNVYLCRVSNENGTVSSPVFRLEVLPAVDVPPTGDNAPILLWTALLLVSAAGLLLVRRNRFNLG